MESSKYQSRPKVAEAMTEPGNEDKKTHLHFNEFYSQLDFQCLNIIYKDKFLCDVVLVAEDMEIQAHKLILSTCSPYFYYKFSKDRHLRLLNRFEVQGVTYKTLSSVVQYLYSSVISITEDNVKDLLAAAYLLALRELQGACHNFLKANLTLRNCIGTGVIAKHCQCEELAQIANDFTLAHFSEVVRLDEYLDLTYDQVLDLISSDVLSIAEEDVLEGVIKWVNHDLQHRKGHIYALLEKVQFLLIPLNNILQKLEVEKWLTSDPHYNLFLLEVFKRHVVHVPHPFSAEYRQYSKCLVVVGAPNNGVLNMEVYDFNKDVWSIRPDFPEIKYNEETTGGAILGTKFYHIDGKSMTVIDISDPAQKTRSDCPQMLERRTFYSTAVLDNSIYVIGGEWNGTCFAKGERFDVSSGEWKRIADMSNSKIQVGLAVLNGNLYAVGGVPLTDSVECYIADSKSWFTMPNMANVRSLAGVTAVGDSLYVVGGWNNGPRKEVEAFNTTNLSWKRLPDMNIARIFHAVIAANGLIYAIGGYDGKLFQSSVEVFDPKSHTWSLLPSKMNIGKNCVAVALVDKVNLKL